jgi:hypothetical protein
MSADNWDRCPRCGDEARKKKVEEWRQADDEATLAYGKTDPEEWVKLRDRARKAADAAEEENSPCTFREDYEIYGADEGVIRVEYHGECQECGLRVEFSFDKPFFTEKG